MNDRDKIEELLKASESGTITAAQVTEAGLHRSVLQELVKSGEIYRFGRGLYVQKDAWEDDFFLLQHKYSRGIYSHDTALYLLGYSDRTPAKYTMTFPKGYNAHSLKQENLIVRRVIPENYALGIIEIKSGTDSVRHSAWQRKRYSDCRRSYETLCSVQEQEYS